MNVNEIHDCKINDVILLGNDGIWYRLPIVDIEHTTFGIRVLVADVFTSHLPAKRS